MDIVFDMLDSIQKKNNRIKPTHLMYKSNLSHKLMNRYLDDLVENEMVEEIEDKGNKYLILKDKGYEFINQFKKMKEFADSFGL